MHSHLRITLSTLAFSRCELDGGSDCSDFVQPGMMGDPPAPDPVTRMLLERAQQGRQKDSNRAAWLDITLTHMDALAARALRLAQELDGVEQAYQELDRLSYADGRRRPQEWGVLYA